ncbi:hypothetical protein AAU61_12715 [Desulfocarbo indianensis]|nr:hypothetical protein AAU61_12715 [Desulfocarbo indianensis]
MPFALAFLLFAGCCLAPAAPAQAEVAMPPEKACRALRGLGLKPGPYKLQGDMHCCLAEVVLTPGARCNSLIYQAFGDRDQVRELRLELSVDQPREERAAKELFTRAALRLAEAAGSQEPPDGLAEAAARNSEGNWEAGKALIDLVDHPSFDSPGGYKLVLTIR